MPQSQPHATIHRQHQPSASTSSSAGSSHYQLQQRQYQPLSHSQSHSQAQSHRPTPSQSSYYTSISPTRQPPASSGDPYTQTYTYNRMRAGSRSEYDGDASAGYPLNNNNNSNINNNNFHYNLKGRQFSGREGGRKSSQGTHSTHNGGAHNSGNSAGRAAAAYRPRFEPSEPPIPSSHSSSLTNYSIHHHHPHPLPHLQPNSVSNQFQFANSQSHVLSHPHPHPRAASSSAFYSASSAPLRPRTSSLLPPPRNPQARTKTSITTTTGATATPIPIPPPTQPPTVGIGQQRSASTSASNVEQGTTPPRPQTQTTADSAAFFLDPLNTPGFGPRRPHSRASSIGAVSEGFRNLNRWSSSTASSRVSNWDQHLYQPPLNQGTPQQQRSLSSFSRRMSLDSGALIAQLADPIFHGQSSPSHSSPRKLHKKRPSTGTTSVSPKTRIGAGVRVGSGTPADVPNLPPIISLPPLNTDPESILQNDPRGVMNRASPPLSTPNSVFSSQHNGEPLDYFWNDISNPSRTNSPVANRGYPQLLPAASVTRDNMPEKKGHTRSRSAANKSSGDSTKARDRANKPSQKAMLSKALSKANAAVQLDNAQNYVFARESYLEACDLLQQVLARTNGEEDRKKLEAIRQTYTSRIEELDGLVPARAQGNKALPSRPDSFDYHGVQVELAGADTQADGMTRTRIIRDEPHPPGRSIDSKTPTEASRFGPSSNPPNTSNRGADAYPSQSFIQSPSRSPRSPMRRNFEGGALSIPRAENGFIPAPLSPRRPVSPGTAPSPEPIVRHDFSISSERLSVTRELKSHRRNLSHESASWLDPIDESGGSASSSVHSRSSSLGVRRKHIRNVSGGTEAEFDAALDAAVEAAYDDGYEPMDSFDMGYDDGRDNDGDHRLANSMRKVQIAREHVRETEREAMVELARERERQRQLSLSQGSQTFGGDFFDANDSEEEEERMLEEMTRGYVMEDFALGRHSRSHSKQSTVPRESDSSGLTSRTWHSSVGSNPPTATTLLSTVSETLPKGSLSKTSPPSMLPPTQALPPRPPSGSGVRNRRLSGQNPKQLKIETAKLGQPPSLPLPPISTSAVPSKPSGGFIAQQRQAQSATSTRGPFSMRVPSSPGRGYSPADAMGPSSPPNHQVGGGHDGDEARTGSPSSVPAGMRKNFSSSSLKSLKSRQASVSQVDDSDMSPNTPLSHQLSNTSMYRHPAMPALPTPIAAAFADKVTGGFGGLHLFDSDFHSPTSHSPSSLHHQQNPDVPHPLEPCPSDAMLRPFWLMRAIYQTLAHPRGGYISNKLFVPRDAWKVKGVKLRFLDDKISQCDLLSAALLKLARVDSNDADAVLEEMQALETVLEVVQATLTRRLGAEVGLQGISSYRDEKDGEPAPVVPRNNSISGKGGAFSWRRLRNKNSNANMTSAYGAKSSSNASSGPNAYDRDTMSSGGSIPSLPMTAHPSSRPAKRDVASVRFDGPYGNYMASLARLFDAAQTVDQIARQVEDPGLRHADKTQVGLELCTRHAAEFFGFYICRFVLADLGMLLDKFVKRGSEWVLN
ncbi:Uu.00g105670.m01.CDS01 [Anthostomella pinea]|uniref:Uu.00g105670.m01.CDS01 n=1 Tax=Anthostomella pinea TaxID=933095 RepID=A0AAI8VEY4_9PEZI|nr:Uu.00g105670.m01.CDS01 [Anthostomella pinea]